MTCTRPTVHEILLNRAKGALVALVVAAPLFAPAAADIGPFHGGPTHYYTTSDGTDIALSVVFPKGFDPSQTYPTILEMAGYENGSASSNGRTTLGQMKDFFCGSNTSGPCAFDPPLADDSHHGTSAFRYAADGYVVVHASLPGTGCSSGEYSPYSFEAARSGYEVIENWIVAQSWSNKKVGIIGHSFSGMTGFLVAAQEGLAAKEGRPNHLVAISVSGLIDDIYRGITYPGGVLNTLFPPLWYLAVRPAYDVLGGSVQGVIRNADNENGARCARNTAMHTRSVENDSIYQGLLAGGQDNTYWQNVSLVGYTPFIEAPIHIAGAFQDEQTGGRGFAHLFEKIPASTPKRLLVSNGDHGTQVSPLEMWADRKAWMDYFMRDISPEQEWGMTNADGTIKASSVRTLFEMQPTPSGVASNGHLDASDFPVEGTEWTDYYFCAGGGLATDRSSCEEGSQSYLSGSRRQSWSYQFGPGAGPPLTTADGGDQIVLEGPVVGAGETFAIAGPVLANLYLSVMGQDTDLYVQVADEDTVGNSVAYLTRGWLKASHRSIDLQKSDYSSVDPSRPNFLYRPYRPHRNPSNVASGTKIDYLIEIWPVAHVFRPGHRLVVIVTAPPAVDSYYSFALQQTQPVSQNTLFFNDPAAPSRITLPVVDTSAIQNLGNSGPGCPGYWRVRCVGNTPPREDPPGPSAGAPAQSSPPNLGESTRVAGARRVAGSSGKALAADTDIEIVEAFPFVRVTPRKIADSTKVEGAQASGLRLWALSLAAAAAAGMVVRKVFK